MKIGTSDAYITVEDSVGSGGANVTGRIHGYVADLHFWGSAIYVARRRNESDLHIIIAPSEHWMQSLADEGFEIIGKLSDLIKKESMDAEST